MGIPFSHKGHQAFCQLIQVRKIADAQSLPLQNAEPLLNLIHPRTVDGYKEADETRVRLKPCLDLFPFMHTQVVKDQRDVTNRSKRCKAFTLPHLPA